MGREKENGECVWGGRERDRSGESGEGKREGGVGETCGCIIKHLTSYTTDLKYMPSRKNLSTVLEIDLV